MNPKRPLLAAAFAALLIPAAADPVREAVERIDAPPGSRIVVATFFAELLPGLRAVAPAFEEETGIRLVVQGVPYAQYRFWVQARFLAFDAPDLLIFEGTADPWQFGQTGQVINLDQVLDRTNPFDPEVGDWRDAFRDELLQFSYDPNGNLFSIPFTQFGVGFFYNQDLYQEAGLEVPSTWTEFVGVLRDAHESEALRARRVPPIAVAIRPNDAQSTWIAGILLECFLRSRIPDVNLRHDREGWEFDPSDPDSVRGERIDVAERVAAFHKGIIDPARSPEFAAAAAMVKETVPYWRPDFLALSGDDLYRLFASGRTLHFMNGTWFLKDIGPLQEQMREAAPDSAFDFGTFPFPAVDGEHAHLARAGGVNQNAGLRSCIMVPVQRREPWREEAAILLAQFLTSREHAQRVFEAGNVYDLPGMEGVRGKPASDPLLPRERYPLLPLAYFEGYDAQGVSEFWPAWQAFLAAPPGDETLERFLGLLSAMHRRSLARQIRIARDAGMLDEDFLAREIGPGWEADW